MRILISIITLSLLCSSALAYVPPFWFLLSRTAKNHGNGLYLIVQDVTFPGEGEPLVVREKWYIAGEDQMRLEATGQGLLKDQVKATFIYEGSQKYFVDTDGVKRVATNKSDWIEPYFHFRYSKKMKPMLVAAGIIPAQALKSKPRIRKVEDIKNEAEDFIRLSRVGGAAAYAIGTATDVNASSRKPGMWVEQDQFLIRKLRIKNGLEIKADNYAKYSHNLWLPKQRQIVWNGQPVEVRIVSVKALKKTRKTRLKLSAKSLDFGKDPKLGVVLPKEAPLVRDFYSQLR